MLLFKIGDIYNKYRSGLSGPKKIATHCQARLGFPDNGRAFKKLNVCNSLHVSALRFIILISVFKINFWEY